MKAVYKTGAKTTATALGANHSSQVVRVAKTGTLFVDMTGTFDGQTVTMYQRPIVGGTWRTFCVDLDGSGTAVAQTWTGASVTDPPTEVNPRGYKVGGMEFKFTVSNGGNPAVVPYVYGMDVTVDRKT